MFLKGGDAAVVTRSATTTKKTNPIGKELQVYTDSGDSGAIMGWGPDNQLPTYRETLVAENNINPSLLATRRDITLGMGLFAYTKNYVDGKEVIEPVPMPPEAEAFFDQLEEDDYWNTAARELVFHAAVATEYVRGKGLNTKIVSAKAHNMRHLRAEKQDEAGKINNWYWSGNWGHQRDKGMRELRAYKIPVYDRNQKQDKFIQVVMDKLLCLDEYYPTPYWWGSEEWIRLANCIPEFHQANLRNGYTLRWHIEIPKGYFMDSNYADLSPEARENAQETANGKKKAFLDHLNNLLAGVDNAGRAVVTEYEISKSLAKDFPGIKIKPLETNLQDEAMLKLFEKSNQANISAQGVHPTLANIETAGKLSSGTEIRNAYLMYLAIKTPMPRKQLLRMVKLVKRENGWPPEIHYGFKDMTLEKLSEDKSGTGEKKEAV